MHHMSLKHQFYIFSSALLLGSVLLIGCIIYPTIKNMFTVSTDIKALQQELESDYSETQAMRRTVRELENATQEVGRYEHMVMTVGDELGMIEQLETLAKEQGVTQTLNVAFSNAPDQTVGLPYYTFTFALTGEMPKLLSFISALESDSLYFIIDTMRFQKVSDGIVGLQFQARIFAKPVSTS